MTTTAIAIANDMRKLQELLESSDDITPEMIADTMEGNEMALGDKLDAAYIHIRNLEGQAKTCDEEAKRLADRKKSFEKHAKSIKQYVLNCLMACGLNSLKTTTNTFTVRKGLPSVIVDNIDAIPGDFVDTIATTTAKKKEIKETIEAAEAAAAEIIARGEIPPDELLNPVPGAHIEIGAQSLQVR
ncbi:siphovirus Gp157 family protein [Symbiopectobacterium purcellii]|uniref:siphovirus Gp157 family protein n=1 Tax=Symbiopectobacterium purcellii TaxID=2871826 RepID=UPI003F85A854